MKKILVLLLCLLGSFTYSQKLDCAKFKNGKFAAPAFPEEYSIRKDSVEESYMNGKLETVWSIKWLSNCKMEKVCVKNYGSEYVKLGDKSVYEMINTDDDCVTYSIVYFSDEYPDGMEFQRGLCLQKE